MRDTLRFGTILVLCFMFVLGNAGCATMMLGFSSGGEDPSTISAGALVACEVTGMMADVVLIPVFFLGLIGLVVDIFNLVSFIKGRRGYAGYGRGSLEHLYR